MTVTTISPAARVGARVRSFIVVAAGLGVFAFSWIFRFNDPGGSFAGLTDDHFFYLVRGWQILFGDLPVRDFVDHGAPLYYYVGWAVQVLFGRGTLPEIVFSVTVLAIGSALTFWLAARASGSIALGLLGAAFEILLEPRFYNYPKILVYAAAIPLLWWFADRPTATSRAWIAVATVLAFLLRHDHGVFVGIAMAVLLLSMRWVAWHERIRHAVIYGALVIAMLSPYLLFIELNGGIASYFRQASAWAERDRDRAPVVWPGLFDNPDGVSDAARSASPVTRSVAIVRDNAVAWTFYLELALPMVTLALLAASAAACRPDWPHAAAKIGTVAVLGAVLDAGFLRSPLEARLADPSVPLAICLAWLPVAAAQLLFSRNSLGSWARSRAVLVRVAVVLLVVPLAFVLWCEVSHDLYRRLDKASMVDGTDQMLHHAETVADQVRKDWDLRSWESRPDRPDLIGLSLYVNACTRPNDRVLVQAYMPQVLALARRAFAGGHADLRPGFFKTEEAQRLVISRLRRQSVPIILLETGESYQNFRESFPLVMNYVDTNYRLAGTRLFDGRFGVNLFVRRDAASTGEYHPYAWPCYGSGVVSAF